MAWAGASRSGSAALVADENLKHHNGNALLVADLAERYGIDVND